MIFPASSALAALTMQRTTCHAREQGSKWAMHAWDRVKPRGLELLQ